MMWKTYEKLVLGSGVNCWLVDIPSIKNAWMLIILDIKNIC